MGLDAVVYTDKENLDLGSDGQSAKHDKKTGEVYFDDDGLSRKHRSKLRGAHRRLGNISSIAALRYEVGQLLGPQSVLLEKVLYSGTHCGDVLSSESLPKLSAELVSIRKAGQRSPLLDELITSLEDLVRAAVSQRNPIVFV